MADCCIDKIYIRDLRVRCIVGINDDERVNKQEVVINITMEADLRTPGQTDKIGDTADYKIIKNDILTLVEKSQFFLIERMADAIASRCLEAPKVQRVTVTVDKPGALRFARSVAVEITRERGA